MRLVIILLIIFVTACQNGHESVDNLKATNSIPTENDTTQTIANTDIVVMCDSIFLEKGYKIILTSRGNNEDHEPKLFRFRFIREVNGKATEIFNDTIESSAQDLKFVDYNGDGLKDILIQNISDVRSNWTYYLFLVNKQLDKLQKIRGFEYIKNPEYIPSLDIISNYVNSGTNWTSFYKIQADSVVDLGIDIEDDLSGDGSYQRKYDQAISSLGKRLKKDRHEKL